MAINRVTVSGNLTRDPELRTTSTGFPVMQVGIAVNERRRNPSTGQWEEKPHFFDCIMYGTRAEKVAKMLAKGSKVSIAGRLRYSSWEARDGSGKRSKVDIVIEEIEFLSQRSAPAGDEAYPGDEGMIVAEGYADEDIAF